MLAPVLAISGKRLHGKSTLAAALARLAADRRRPLAVRPLASESKRAFVAAQAAEGARVDLARLLGGDRAYKETWRPQLTAFTEAELARDPHVFLKAALDAPLPEGVEGLLVPDVRLAVEVEHLRARAAAGGRVLLARLRVTPEVRARFGWTFHTGVDDHRTEVELDGRADWDAVVDNPGTLKGLEAAAERLLNRFFG